MIQNISIVGGDLRIVYLAKMLANEKYKIKIFGIDKEELFRNNIKICNSIEETVKDNKYVISSIPFSKDGLYLNTPFSESKITVKDFFKIISNKTLIAGSFKDNIIDLAEKNNIEIIDLMENEKIAINNTISTAEGTIKIAIEETDKTIFNSNILILGFGKVGKIVAERFYGLKGNIFCEARREEDIAWIKAYGYNAIKLEDIDEKLNKFDIIINTIPAKVVNEERLKIINRECLIIDLASNPGGVDYMAAEKYGIKTIHALGIPGKIAPYTSATYLKESIIKLLI